MRKQFLAQGGAIDAERLGRAALVAAAPVQHLGQQRDFHFAQQKRVKALAAGRAVEIGEITAGAARHALMQGRGAAGFCTGGMNGRYRIQGRGFHVSSFDSAVRCAPGSVSVAPSLAKDKCCVLHRHSKPNSNATAFLPGSSTSNATAIVAPGASPAARVFGSLTYSAGRKRRIATSFSSRSESAIRIGGYGWVKSASLRMVALMISAPGTLGCGRMSRESRVSLEMSCFGGSVQRSAAQTCASSGRVPELA